MFERIDWTQPWLQPLRSIGEQAVSGHEPLHEGLNRLKSAPIRFVPQSDLSESHSYEQFIFETRSVPTRDNLHDFFNGLIWIHFPKTKTRLNELQAAEIAKAGVQPLRGPVRDALTVFDENAALLIAPQPLWDALAARDWRRCSARCARCGGRRSWCCSATRCWRSWFHHEKRSQPMCSGRKQL